MPVLDLGKVVGDPGASMRYRGAWNSGSEYFNNASYIDAVTHNGSLWICKVTNTNQVPATGTYWGIGAQGMAEDNMVFSAYSAFPSVGDENKLYIDNTVNPSLMYIWNGSAYIPAGGGGEITAADVTYSNTSSGLTADNVQAAIDENAEAISGLNSRIPYAEIFSTTISSLPAGQNTYFDISINIPEGFAIGAVTLWCGDGSSGRIPVLYSTPSSTLYGFVRNEGAVGSNIPVYALCLFVPDKS